MSGDRDRVVAYLAPLGYAYCPRCAAAREIDRGSPVFADNGAFLADACDGCQEPFRARPGLYARDGKCHNSEPGHFGHECGLPAVWLGTKASGFQSGFCQSCRDAGAERHGYVTWVPFPR
jgi:hypothetical protein